MVDGQFVLIDSLFSGITGRKQQEIYADGYFFDRHIIMCRIESVRDKNKACPKSGRLSFLTYNVKLQILQLPHLSEQLTYSLCHEY